MTSNTNLSYRQIMVGGFMVGLVGLSEAFDALAAEGLANDAPELGARLLAAAQEYNYIPKAAVAKYEEALRREYARHLAQAPQGDGGRVWRDPRKEHSPWYPTLFAEKCNGCGDCIPVCPNGVLGWNAEHTLALVLEPYECAPGCELCASRCRPRAIIMPPRTLLHRRMPGA